jgi:hypothetical protein
MVPPTGPDTGQSSPGADPGWIALATALLPFLTVHLCYLIAAGAGLIPTCIPYLEGCTSVSATGRYGWSYFLFKGGMLPAAALTALCWLLCREWLRQLGDTPGRWPAVIAWVGCIAALFLALYAVFLGHKGEAYNLMRRFGVSVYFGFSYLAQLMLLARLVKLEARGLALPRRLLTGMKGLATALLALGLGSIPVSNFVADKDPVENAIEWIFCALLVAHQLLIWRAWAATGFRLQFQVYRR